MKYVELSNRKQINLVRKKAILAAKEFNLPIDSIKCVNHGYNTTFKIVSNKNTYALRLGVSTPRSLANIQAEHQWLNLLKKDFPVPELIKAAKSGKTIVVLPADEIFAAIPVTLMRWVPGSPLGDKSARTKIRLFEQLGEQTARLHQQAKKMRLHKNAKLESLDGVFWSRPNRIKNFSKLYPQFFTAKKQKRINQLLTKALRTTNRYWKSEEKIAIHADLHAWNINATKDSIYILDFDDCGLSVPIWDIAVTLYYHSTDKDFSSLIKSYVKGYRKISELPVKNVEDLRQFLIGRALLLMNEIVGMTAANIKKDLANIFARIEKRISTIEKFDFKKALLLQPVKGTK